MVLVRVCLILSVAAFGAVVVHNITDMLKLMAYHPATIAMAQHPQR